MILISPYSKPMRNGERNPKNYPYWQELIDILFLKDNLISQIGVPGDIHFNKVKFLSLNMQELTLYAFLNKNYYHTIISVDNFFPHMSHYYNKQCIALWGQSDPELFGYKENINLLKDRKYLRPNQFDTWENCKFNADAFLSAEEVFKQIKHLL